ncbi:MAG: RNA polymerase sigma factor [Oscillospiraceae bacterium]|nr:RNA polymerase sigma factor [Oscillospiraceae bacterium]
MIYTEKRKYLNYLVEEYSDMVYRLAMARTKEKENAEDVYQEVFLRLSKKIPNFESTEHEKAWIIRVTINCSKNILSSKHLKHNVELKENIYDDNTVPDKNDEANDLYCVVLDLPLKYRTVIHLFYYEGYKIEEISKILKTKENTVKSWLSRARERIKTKMEEGAKNE